MRWYNPSHRLIDTHIRLSEIQDTSFRMQALFVAVLTDRGSKPNQAAWLGGGDLPPVGVDVEGSWCDACEPR